MQVYLSYARPDSELAESLATALNREGFSVWIDQREILPGDNWATATAEALEKIQRYGRLDHSRITEIIEFHV